VERDHLTLFERDLFRLVNDLPSVLGAPVVLIMQAGNLAAGPVAAAVALSTRARRAALDLMVAGPFAWLAAKGVKHIVGRPRPGGLLDDVQRLEGSAGMGFVSGHTAVAVALATVASPYLPRRWRWVVWGVAWSVGFARIYEGAHLPLDVVGGAALGWAVGATVLLVLGAPHGIPGLSQARAALVAAGFEASDVAHVPGEPQGSFPFIATVGGRAVFVKLLDPEPRNRDLLFRVIRFLMVRDVRDEAALSDATAQAEHEAAMTLLARQAGVRCPSIVRVERLGRQVWLIEEAIDGVSLDSLAGAEVPDRLLEETWEQVAALHRGGIAHRDLVASNVVVDGAGDPWLVDLAHATTSFRPATLENDAAELLVATAAIVGTERAVAAAANVLGPDRVAPAGAELQPLALTAVGRRTLRSHRAVFGELHAALTRLVPSPRERTIEVGDRWRTWRAVAAGAGVWGVMVGVAGALAVWAEVTGGSWRWAGGTLVAASILQLQRARSVASAAGRPLGLGRTALACMAADGDAIAARGAWATSLAVHLSRAGVPPVDSVVALRRRAFARIAVVALAAVVAALAVTATGATWRWKIEVPILLTLAVMSAVVSPSGTRPPWRRWLSADVRAEVLLFAVSAELVTGAAVLVGAVKTVGGSPAVWAVLLVGLVAVAAEELLPRMGLGFSTALIASGLIAAGLPAEKAVAAVLIWCAAVQWLPALVVGVLRRPLARRMVI
jgi:undecaprenyl-diphosphatase